jgi:hypothetical protein
VPTNRKKFKQNLSLVQVRRLIDTGKGFRLDRLIREHEIDVLRRYFHQVPFSEGVELFRTPNGRIGIFVVTGSDTVGGDAAEVERTMYFREVTYVGNP